MTPRARTSGDSAATATYAPRILNAPIGWSDSALRNRRSVGRPNGTSGVRTATPVSSLAARRTSSRVTSPSSRAVPSTVAERSATTADQSLAVDAMGGPREGREPLSRDRASAPDTRPERAFVQSPDCRTHRRELLLVPFTQREISLLLEHLGRGGRLGAVGHRPGRDDRLGDLRNETGTFRGKDRSGLVELVAIRHAWIVQAARERARIRDPAILQRPAEDRGPGPSRNERHGHRDRSRLRHAGRHDDDRPEARAQRHDVLVLQPRLLPGVPGRPGAVPGPGLHAVDVTRPTGGVTRDGTE